MTERGTRRSLDVLALADVVQAHPLAWAAP